MVKYSNFRLLKQANLFQRERIAHEASELAKIEYVDARP
jgi:hypothetical protein